MIYLSFRIIFNLLFCMKNDMIDEYCNQYVEENQRLRGILAEWSARAAKVYTLIFLNLNYFIQFNMGSFILTKVSVSSFISTKFFF